MGLKCIEAAGQPSGCNGKYPDHKVEGSLLLQIITNVQCENKMITEESKYDIHGRIFNFIVRVVKLVNSLPKNEANTVILQQLLRSATSIGANDQEADGALTKKDFVHCYTITRKESKETLFWLRLISETNPTLKEKMGPLLKENQELVSIISTIINNSRKALRKT